MNTLVRKSTGHFFWFRRRPLLAALISMGVISDAGVKARTSRRRR